MVNYLTKLELSSINAEVVTISNDPYGILNEANLVHIVDVLQFKYSEMPDEVLLKAAYLLDYIANKGHIFIEGNKRTAETATIAFLHINGLHFVEEDQKQLTEFILTVAQNKKSLTTIAAWLRERVKREFGH